MSVPNHILTGVVRTGLLVGGCGLFVAAGVAWLLPPEVVQSWAVDRAGPDEFARFEAFAASEVLLWLVRGGATAGAALLLVAWFRRRKTVPPLVQAIQEFWRVSMPLPPGPAGQTLLRRFRCRLPRLLLVAWMLLAIYHAGASVLRRVWDWPVYRLHDGPTVLPNISDSNREVIRYLQAATPPGSRILVLSDQKLFFLSYYLLPRRLYHPMHPDAEFVIPQPYNRRQLAAYRLGDLDPARVERLRPDFILEYFEGSPFTSGEDLERDAAWVRFQRQRRGPAWRPQYLVALRRVPAGDAP